MTARKAKLNQIKIPQISRQKSSEHKIEPIQDEYDFHVKIIVEAWHGLGHTTTIGQSRRLGRLAVIVAVCV